MHWNETHNFIVVPNDVFIFHQYCHYDLTIITAVSLIFFTISHAQPKSMMNTAYACLKSGNICWQLCFLSNKFLSQIHLSMRNRNVNSTMDAYSLSNLFLFCQRIVMTEKAYLNKSTLLFCLHNHFQVVQNWNYNKLLFPFALSSCEITRTLCWESH